MPEAVRGARGNPVNGDARLRRVGHERVRTIGRPRDADHVDLVAKSSEVLGQLGPPKSAHAGVGRELVRNQQNGAAAGAHEGADSCHQPKHATRNQKKWSARAPAR